MFMKHYAPNRCEPSIEALKFKKNIYTFFFFFFLGWGGGGAGQVRGVRVDVNREVNFL